MHLGPRQALEVLTRLSIVPATPGAKLTRTQRDGLLDYSYTVMDWPYAKDSPVPRVAQFYSYLTTIVPREDVV